MNKKLKIINLLLFLTYLSTSNFHVIDAYTLNASTLTALGYNNMSANMTINDANITDIDPNAFKGYTQLRYLSFYSCNLTTIDLQMFKYAINLNFLQFLDAPLTKITNKYNIQLHSLQELDFICANYFFFHVSKVIDTNVIKGLPNLIINSDWCYNLDPLKPNELAPWKKLQYLRIFTRNQISLSKAHFNGVPSLSYISFVDSNITTLDVHSFTGLANLTQLNLAGNSLRSLEYLQIPSKLENLDLSFNKLNYFKLSKTIKVIKSLSLSNNQFRSFRSMDFTLLSNLQTLDLSHNPHAYSNEFPSYMKPLINLSYVDLSYLSINSIDSTFFKYNNKLGVIVLFNNNISRISWDAFSRLKNLGNLWLSYNQITELHNITNVRASNLDISYNKISKLGPGAFNNVTIAFFGLRNNLLTELVKNTFFGNNSLPNIDLSFNKLSKIESGSFSGLNEIERLNLGYNQLTELDNSTFSGISRVVVSLNLANNNISKIGPGTFNNMIIQDLYLNNNLLTEINNNTFMGMTILRELYLSNNALTRITLNKMPILENIYLDGNQLTQLDNSTFIGCNNLYGIYLANNPNLSTANLQSLCPTAKCKVYY